MQTLSCPVPSNINPLQNNGFLFAINKLPEVTFFCQEVALPPLDLPPAEMPTPLVDAPLPGDKLNFGELSIVFLVDGEMANYVAVHNWMVGLGFPESHQQYRSFINKQDPTTNPNQILAGFSDGVLQILGPSGAVRTVRFVDLYPTSLNSLQLQSTVDSINYLAGQASFRYSYYRFE